MRSARGAALILAGVTVVYLVLLGQIGWGLIASGEAVGVAMGIAVLAFPLVGIWLIWRELSFGFRAQRLHEQWINEGLPIPEATDAEFAECRDQVEQRPDDWHAWFRLGLAYAVAGDKSRARSAMRHADFVQRRAGGVAG